MKKAFLLTIIGIIALGTLVFRFTQKNITDQSTSPQKPQNVTVQTVTDRTAYTEKVTYPGIVVGDQQITVTAGASGTITSLNFDLGKNVGKGQRLATIDLTGSQSTPGENGLKSGTIRSLELAVESAKESYKRAKDAYKEDDTYANKKDKEIAEIAVDSAEAALQSALDGQFVTAPISGAVIERFVSLGDSISTGQPIATISKTGLSKIQFYISNDELTFVKNDMPITITMDQKEIQGKIDTISPQADTKTKRFLIEATPVSGHTLTIGSVTSVSFDIVRKPTAPDHIIVPLSVITVGQNESYLFVAQDQTARKVPITIHTVNGETAEISSENLAPHMQIIFDGSKLVHDGESVLIIQ